MRKRALKNLVPFALLALAVAIPSRTAIAQIDHIQGEMAGAVTADSVILQSRLTAPKIDAGGDVPGAAGAARFAVADDPQFDDPSFTPWIEADPEYDYVIKTKVAGLKPNTRYYYRLEFGLDRAHAKQGPTRTFKTCPGGDAVAPTSLVIVTGMNYARFFASARGKGPDRELGYPALASIRTLKPDAFIGTGDNVYYDSPPNATTIEQLRRKWHEQFVQPRYIELFSEVPTYWEKDDHDHRFNDNDNTGDRPPSSELGIRIFREQVPVTDPADPQAVTYSTVRISKLLQIWLLEGRDYRSPNRSPDGPEKTIWGTAQREWLKRTLLESDAPCKLVISPTPLVGPDDRYKKDNHTNIGGFRHEGTAFFDWAKENGFLEKGLYFVCGDRHWQYHSIHPSGFEEFSTGALVDGNSRMGVKPGAKNGTDQEALIRQPYTSREPSGGFLNVLVEPGGSGQGATITFNFHDEEGVLLYAVKKAK